MPECTVHFVQLISFLIHALNYKDILTFSSHEVVDK